MMSVIPTTAANVAHFSVSVAGRTLTPSGLVRINDIRDRTPVDNPALAITGGTQATYSIYAQSVGGDRYQLLQMATTADMSGRSDCLLVYSVLDYPSLQTL